MSAEHAGTQSGGELDLLSGQARADRLLDGLGESERAAVTHRGRRLLLRGGAGTGKTWLIEHRYRWLVGQGNRPERLCLVVPGAGRAGALRERLEAVLERGYDELHVLTPVGLAGLIVARAGGGIDAAVTLGAGERLALLVPRIDELSLRHHDIGGRPTLLLAGFVRRIDRLKAEGVGVESFAAWAQSLPPDDAEGELEREFAAVYRTHERLLAAAGARDAGGLIADAISLVRRRPELGRTFAHVLVDDAQELELGAAQLVEALAAVGLTVAGDPAAALHRFRGAGAQRLDGFAREGTTEITLRAGRRCPAPVWAAARAALSEAGGPDPGDAAAAHDGRVQAWRCENERSQAQAIAAEIERLLAREGADAQRIAVFVPDILHEGQAVGAALEERAITHRLVGEAAFFQRAEIRDVLAWLRLLADPTDAGAVVRALARPPIELRSVDIARCTQIARRRKLDMVGALVAALESPQVPPEARERIRGFLKLHRAGVAAIDTLRPDVYVHRLIDRLGLRRQQLFAAQTDVVERLRALAALGELASAFGRRSPQATPREFAQQIAAVADFGLRDDEDPELTRPGAVQVLALEAAGGLEADHVFLAGLHAAVPAPAPEAIPAALLTEPLPADDEAGRHAALAQRVYAAISRTAETLVLAYAQTDDRGTALRPSPLLEAARAAAAVSWEDRAEQLFGPAEALHSTYLLMRDELLTGTLRAGGRLSELRFDTDLDVSHAVVRYLELLKLAALIARPEGQSVAESLRDVNSRILQAVTAEQREIFTSSPLDEYLLDSERDARRRAQAVVARDEPSLEPFLPRRGEGVMLSASDIDTYRTCPLKYKFARVFRIPQEPTLHQRFGILVHQVLERFHARDGAGGPPGLPDLLGLLDAGWRRGGFGDSEEERQLRGKASAALTRYHERFQTEPAQPMWFERQFTFKLGRHMLRGRVDRVDRLPGGEYELIDYKTGRPKRADQLADDVQLSLYAVGAREAWQLDASQGAYYYVLDDQKVAVPGDRAEWVCDVATEVAEGIQSQGFEPTPSYSACSMCDYRLVCPAAER
ncbi:MAG TPA: ATP-dependent DNA helicase [Solirubrobacteraceae bacterium]|nr:ATP-dependent DNA helicase [Solirubrobacteraceae bacterium]